MWILFWIQQVAHTIHQIFRFFAICKFVNKCLSHCLATLHYLLLVAFSEWRIQILLYFAVSIADDYLFLFDFNWFFVDICCCFKCCFPKKKTVFDHFCFFYSQLKKCTQHTQHFNDMRSGNHYHYYSNICRSVIMYSLVCCCFSNWNISNF